MLAPYPLPSFHYDGAVVYVKFSVGSTRSSAVLRICRTRVEGCATVGRYVDRAGGGKFSN